MKADTHTNKYQKVLLIAQRTKQLQNGARPRISLVGEKASRVARTEVEQGLIKLRSEGGQQEATQTPLLPTMKKAGKK